MMQTVINAALAAYANAAEPERAQLDLATVGNVLGEGGYELVCRFGQVHAAADFQEWHVCLVGDLAPLHPAHFLAGLKEAITVSLQLSAVR